MLAMDVPNMHKAIVYDKPGQISVKVVDIPTPKPGRGEVLVKITHSGICHSDLSLMQNSWEGLPPVKSGQVGGHEGVGHIVQLGPGCEDFEYKLGDRVGIKWLASACLSCRPCMAGAEAVCTKQEISGYTRPGTFQQYVATPIHYVTPIPSDLNGENAAPLLCGGLTVYSALSKSRAQPGEWVAISGAGGGLGHLAVQIGKGMGFQVLGIDDQAKEDFVKACGADGFAKIQAPVKEKVLEITGGEGVAAVVVCSGNNAAYGSALDLLRFNGVLVCVGVPGGQLTPIAGAYPGAMVGKQLNIAGSTVGSRKQAVETLLMASRGVVKTHVSVIGYQGVEQAFQDMKAGKLEGRVVLDMASLK